MKTISGKMTGGLLALGVGLALGAPPLVGQEVAVPTSPHGWLGIRYALDVPQAPDRPEAEPTMVILDVQDDSPARRAGVAPGDTVLRIDGRVVSGATLADLRSLEPGQRVRLTLRRAGRTVDADVVAGRRAVAVVPHISVLFRSQEADSLRREMTRLQWELQRVSQAEAQRIRELAEEMARARREIDQNDARLREFREREARLQVEMARMRQEMERAQVEARRQQTERLQRLAEQSRWVAERSQEVAVEVREAFRPLSLYAAGQNMLAGARLTDLNPALAEYFEAERGVLVTEVLEDTPAAQAPLVAGDVIVRVGETGVADLAGLRAALARSSGSATLTVVRKGRRVTVELPRE